MDGKTLLIFPISVKISIPRNNPPIIAEGIMMRNDLDNTRNTKKPAIRQNVDVLVPDANICQMTIMDVIR